MADYRTMFDSNYIHSWHLGGQARTLTIARVVAGEIENKQAKSKKKMPLVYFEKQEKALGLNKTNCKTLAGMYGTDTTKWVGQRITIYPTTTKFGRDTVDCVRIKPGLVDAKTPTDELPADAVPPTPREPGDDTNAH